MGDTEEFQKESAWGMGNAHVLGEGALMVAVFSKLNAVLFIAITWSCFAHGHSGTTSDTFSAGGNAKTQTSLMQIEDCQEIVRLKNIERNMAGIGPTSDAVVTRFFDRFCNTTNRMMLRGDLPKRNEYSLAKDLRATKRFSDKEDVVKYVKDTYPSMSRGKQENLVTALMAAKALDDTGGVQSAEVSSKVHLVN